jgi:hypothetical protein
MELIIKWGNSHTALKTEQFNNKGKHKKHKTQRIGKIIDTGNLKILGCLRTCTEKYIPAHYVPGCHRVNKTSLYYNEEKSDLSWGYAVPVAGFNLLAANKNKKIGKMYPKDLLSYDSFQNTLFECTTSGFGPDCIDQSDMIPHTKNRKQNLILDKGIRVQEFWESNPCSSCIANGLQYYCSMTDGCTSKISRIRAVKSTPCTAKSTPSNLVLPEQNHDHSSECFYTSIMGPNILLIDGISNVTACENVQGWSDIPDLGNKDYYYETVQSHGKSIKILLPEHRKGFLNKITKSSLKDTLRGYSFSKVFLNCTCRITFDNIQSFLNQPDNEYVVYKIHKCQHNKCGLSGEVSNQN